MRVTQGVEFVPEPLVQPCPDQTDAFLQAIVIDEEREPVDRPVGRVLAGDYLNLLHGVRHGNVLGGVAGQFFEVERCA